MTQKCEMSPHESQNMIPTGELKKSGTTRGSWPGSKQAVASGLAWVSFMYVQHSNMRLPPSYPSERPKVKQVWSSREFARLALAIKNSAL